MRRLAGVAIASLAIVLPFASASAQAPTFPNDPLFPKQLALHNTGQFGGHAGADIAALDAWALTRCSPDEIIADLDTGIDSQHPDLASKLVPGASFVPGVTSTEDDNGHGTGTAGVAAAVTDNGTGIAGICPLGRIMPVKVANAQGHTVDPMVAQGIRWAVDHGARVINMSLGTDNISEMRDAVAYAYSHNVVVVAATPGGDTYPADYPHVIAVGGSDRMDHAISQATHATNDLVLAPADDVLTTDTGGGYTVFCTCVSISSPEVAGIAALILALRPDMTVSQVIAAIEHGANLIDNQTGFNAVDGWGRVNAYRSLELAGQLPPFRLKVAEKAKSLTSGTRQTITIQTLVGTALLLRSTAAGQHPMTRKAQVGSSGVYRYTWTVTSRTGTVSVWVTATHGWEIKKAKVHFTIR